MAWTMTPLKLDSMCEKIEDEKRRFESGGLPFLCSLFGIWKNSIADWSITSHDFSQLPFNPGNIFWKTETDLLNFFYSISNSPSSCANNPPQILLDLTLSLQLYFYICGVYSTLFFTMQRALASRTSVLGRSSTSKLRAGGYGAQQLRFAHKVCSLKLQELDWSSCQF